MHNSTLRWSIFTGIITAFAGTFAGSHLIKKVTLKFIKYFVGILLLLMAFALGFGIV